MTKLLVCVTNFSRPELSTCKNGSYSDTGAFVIAVGTRPENCQQVVDIILEELEDIRQKGITQQELEKVPLQSWWQRNLALYMLTQGQCIVLWPFIS